VISIYVKGWGILLLYSGDVCFCSLKGEHNREVNIMWLFWLVLGLVGGFAACYAAVKNGYVKVTVD